MKKLIILALALCSFRAVQYAERFEGLTEKNNRSQFVDFLNRRIGSALGSPYCAAFGSMVLDSVHAKYPKIRSVQATKFITKESYTVKQVLLGYKTLKSDEDYLVIWQRSNTWKGHIGFYKRFVSKYVIETIEANTSSGNVGSQDNGDGIFSRKRDLTSLKDFRIKYFTPVRY